MTCPTCHLPLTSEVRPSTFGAGTVECKFCPYHPEHDLDLERATATPTEPYALPAPAPKPMSEGARLLEVIDSIPDHDTACAFAELAIRYLLQKEPTP